MKLLLVLWKYLHVPLLAVLNTVAQRMGWIPAPVAILLQALVLAWAAYKLGRAHGARHLVACLLIGLCLSSCKTMQHPTDERANAQQVSHFIGLDSTSVGNPPFAPPALVPRLTDAIGLSTPEGRARRQAVKLAKAAVPRSIGKGAVYAPLATEVINTYKPRATVAVASDSATLQVATNAVAGHDNAATQTATTQEAPSVGATIAKAITGPLGYVLALAAAGAIGYLVYLIWAFLPRRRDNTA
jgi:hypothetical protein